MSVFAESPQICIIRRTKLLEILKIAAQDHSSLIGQNGKYAIRLDEECAVKTTFPRQNASRKLLLTFLQPKYHLTFTLTT